jgi:hypothetical protein
MKRPASFIYRNSLSIALLFIFLGLLCAQALTGWKEHNQELEENNGSPLSFRDYISTGHFIETTFENWESEFLQMAAYVLLTVWLRQRGSSESKSLDKSEAVDREPDPGRRGAPWPVKKGGFILTLYENSLSIVLATLFLVCLMLHAWGSLRNYNEEQLLRGHPDVSLVEFLHEPRFWFESFQNWQSEFIAVLSIVLLSIFLRQKGSPQSKPVDAPDHETGS